MSILKEIIAHKQKEVKERKGLFPVKLLEQSIYFDTEPVSLVKYIRRDDKEGIIAEIKRKSPSKGLINAQISIERTSIGYMQAGASGLSILTDQKYFGGKNEDLSVARSFNFCPILRKDFIIDEYQILEAKSIGADVILLIAAILSKEKIAEYTRLAHTLGMEVLLEVHSHEEFDQSFTDEVDLLGVNNRDLNTFKTDVNTSVNLSSQIPSTVVKVSESGISEPEKVVQLKEHGFEGFLIGEYFMQFGRPDKACREFIKKINLLQSEKISES